MFRNIFHFKCWHTRMGVELHNRKLIIRVNHEKYSIIWNQSVRQIFFSFCTIAWNLILKPKKPKKHAWWCCLMLLWEKNQVFQGTKCIKEHFICLYQIIIFSHQYNYLLWKCNMSSENWVVLRCSVLFIHAKNSCQIF